MEWHLGTKSKAIVWLHQFCKFSSCVWCMQLLKMHDYGLDLAFLSAAGTWMWTDGISIEKLISKGLAGKTALSVRWEMGCNAIADHVFASRMRVELRWETEVARRALATYVEYTRVWRDFLLLRFVRWQLQKA